MRVSPPKRSTQWARPTILPVHKKGLRRPPGPAGAGADLSAQGSGRGQLATCENNRGSYPSGDTRISGADPCDLVAYDVRAVRATKREASALQTYTDASAFRSNGRSYLWEQAVQ